MLIMYLTKILNYVTYFIPVTRSFHNKEIERINIVNESLKKEVEKLRILNDKHNWKNSFSLKLLSSSEYSEGYPSQPSWGWNKAKPKKSLEDIGMANTASWLNLNIVELVHWTPIIPAVLMAYSVLQNSSKWTYYFGGDETRTLLLLLSPIIAFFGGLPGIMMHTYEGWQVAPFENPLKGESHNMNVVVSDNNNQWLRIVAYFFIFSMQYLGLQAFSYAILGPEALGGFLGLLSVTGFFIAYLGNQDYKATFYFKFPGSEGGSTFPLAWATLVPFILSATLNVYAFIELGKLIFPGPLHIIQSIAPPLLIALGGAIEGLFAETIFDQKIHAFAVILFNTGFWLEYDFLNKAADILYLS